MTGCKHEEGAASSLPLLLACPADDPGRAEAPAVRGGPGSLCPRRQPDQRPGRCHSLQAQLGRRWRWRRPAGNIHTLLFLLFNYIFVSFNTGLLCLVFWSWFIMVLFFFLILKRWVWFAGINSSRSLDWYSRGSSLKHVFFLHEQRAWW